jgi:hypothetical protein
MKSKNPESLDASGRMEDNLEQCFPKRKDIKGYAAQKKLLTVTYNCKNCSRVLSAARGTLKKEN